MHQPLYNPALLRDADLKNSFAVRERELDELLRMIRTQPQNGALQHALIVGSRGMGKTTLGLRLLVAVREDPELSTKWQPVPFFEESYGIIDLASLWLTALQHLSDATGDGQWRDRARALLQSEADTARLEAQALGLLIDFCRDAKRRLLLFIENIDEVFEQFVNQNDIARLRAVLQERSELLLIGTANAVFGEITDRSKPFYEYFRLFRLSGLDRKETRAFVDKLASRLQSSTLKFILEEDPARIEVIRQFTGGNPRLIELASRLITESPVGDVRDDLERLIDDHTPYFKARIENLPHQLRAIFHSLAAGWKPMSAREVAKLTRLSSSQASAQLKKLQSLGYVEVIRGETKRRLRYQVLERFYNMYYLWRFTRDQRQRLEKLINIFHQLFGPSSIERMFQATLGHCRVPSGLPAEGQETLPIFLQFAASLKDLDERRTWWKSALKSCAESGGVVRELIEMTPEVLGAETAGSNEYKTALERYVRENPGAVSAWLSLGQVLREMGHINESVAALCEAQTLAPDRSAVWHQAGVLFERMGQVDQAVSSFRRLTELTPDDPHGYVHLAMVLDLANRSFEAAKAIDKAIEAAEAVDKTIELGSSELLEWLQIGHVLFNQERVAEAEKAFRQAIEISPESDAAHVALGELLDSLGSHEEATEMFEKVASLSPRDTPVWISLGFHALRTRQIAEAERAFRSAINLDSHDSNSWAYLGGLLAWETDRIGEAEEALRKAVELDGDNSDALHHLGVVLENQNRLREAEKVYRTLIDSSAEKEHGLIHLAVVLRDMDRKDEGEALLRDFLEDKPASSLAWTYLGSYLAGDDRLDEAIKCMRKAIELQHDNPNYLNSLALYLFKRSKPEDLEVARDFARRADRLNPENPDILHTLAVIVAGLGKWEKALDYLDSAIAKGGGRWCERHIRELIDLLVDATAHNRGELALQILRTNDISSLVEPLTLAIMLELEKPIDPVPEEIMSAANEIRRRITEQRNAIIEGMKLVKTQRHRDTEEV